MRGILVLTGVLGVLTCTACSDPRTEHVWKDQTDMIDRSRAVEATVLDASRQQRRQIDEMAQ